MAGYVVVGLTLALVMLGVSLVGPIVAPSVTPLTGVKVDGTALTLYFLVFATVYNAILLAAIGLYDRRKRYEGVSEDHTFSLVVPCRNEEAVVEQTVRGLMALDYPRSKFEVLVVNDGSSDLTGEIAGRLATEFPNMGVLEVRPDQGGRGKSVALNRAFDHLQDISPFSGREDWVLGVFDADGVPDGSVLRKASFALDNPKTGAVQTLVRIADAKRSILTMLQDIEFVTFAKVTQFARSIFKGAVALGGNGQFVRPAALKSVEISPGEYWKNGALTEDLDLGTRVLLAGWENMFLSTTAVYQHGVTSLTALYKQRTRWSWGALQCFTGYALNLKVMKANMGAVRRLDLLYYLSAAILPPLILTVWALSILGITGIIVLHNPFPVYFMIANSISFFPLIGYGLWTVRKDYSGKLMVPLLILTNAYTYHWVICTTRAMVHVVKGDKPTWVVTRKSAPKTRVPKTRVDIESILVKPVVIGG